MPLCNVTLYLGECPRRNLVLICHTGKKRADENAGPKKVFRRGCLKGLLYMLGDSKLCKCEKEKCNCKKRKQGLGTRNPAQNLAFFHSCMRCK
jgi:hypothetical protein